MRIHIFTTLQAMSFTALTGLSSAALAGPMYTFTTSKGLETIFSPPVRQEKGGVEKLSSNKTDKEKRERSNAEIDPFKEAVTTLNQMGARLWDKDVVPIDSKYGLLSPLFFKQKDSGELDIKQSTPTTGIFAFDPFGPDRAGGGDKPFEHPRSVFGNWKDNASGKAYYDDIIFKWSRSDDLNNKDFVTGSKGANIGADFTEGSDTGAQAWEPQSALANVPEPLTLALFGAGLVGVVMLRRRKVFN